MSKSKAAGNPSSPEDAFAEEAAKYLEINEVYDLFQGLLQKLIMKRPAKPLDFLVECLKEKPSVRICIVSPPGSVRPRISKNLAEEFGVPLIQAGDLIKEANKNTSDGKLSSDEDVIEIITAKLNEIGEQGGWALDGFPRTKLQAIALQQYHPDKLLILNSELPQTAKEEPKEMMKWDHYYRHIAGITEVYKNIIGQVDTGKLEKEEEIFESAKKFIHLRPLSVAPQRAPRICIIGPTGSGCTTQARILAEKSGCVNVDVTALLNEKGRPTSDVELCSIVGDRLQQVDCLRLGWVLDGFPKTLPQAEYLHKNFWPTRIIFLKCTEQVCLRRLSLRKLDPVTGKYVIGIPDDPAVQGRLVKAEYDKPENVKARCDAYSANYFKFCGMFHRIEVGVESSVGISEVADMVEAATLQCAQE